MIFYQWVRKHIFSRCCYDAALYLLSDSMFSRFSLSVTVFPVLNISRLTGRVLTVLQIWTCGWLDCGGQRKHMPLCVVGPDMSKLSIDHAICSRKKLWAQISNETVVAIQCQGSLFCFVLVGISVARHICMPAGLKSS